MGTYNTYNTNNNLKKRRTHNNVLTTKSNNAIKRQKGRHRLNGYLAQRVPSFFLAGKS